MDIIEAGTAAHYAAFAGMVRDYVGWLRARYADDGAFLSAVFDHQSLDAELAALPEKYGPPRGRTLLAVADGTPVGCVAYRAMTDAACEMKRLFVGPAGQGRGLGRKLCEALFETARADGYKVMRLDTADRLAEAIALYRSLGFRDCPPFHDYPEPLARKILFMDRPL